MYLKRFIQLFVIFLIAAAILTAIFSTNFTGNIWLTFIVAVIVAYAVLTLPLVILTVAKANKKANAVGTSSQKGELAAIFKKLPGYIALAVTDNEGQTATTIMSFIQAQKQENVLYMVAELDTQKVAALKSNPKVSFTSWFESLETGARLSSNKVTSELLTDAEANKALVEEEPELLSLHENAVNMAIIKLTIQSALYEDFKDGLKVLSF